MRFNVLKGAFTARNLAIFDLKKRTLSRPESRETFPLMYERKS
jgi:hypothetical protein